MSTRDEILELIAYSAWLYDTKQADELADLYAEDGSFTTIVQGGKQQFGPTVGREALRERFVDRFAVRSEPLRHVVTNTWFREESDDRVVAVSNLTLYVVEENGPRVQATGFYIDTFVKIGTDWRYASKMSHLDSPFQ
ncbi:nuclear transport factor 2 family protein [Nocardia cyriacigeorgica]|uniref:nuclear transport factor 2 family protein n=1 Tax=Nocardia cyriacigeorgica TaxID=135487 RepID=UPI0013CFB4C2|nr:nuclear transport factor 2 family protein [Nocardia cyriacigeorgica]NEW27105.1 nuclear transport factor 2 family protein [Nocardia cyriacigeorgica]